jgi:uncharacterized protein YbbK (DUF523 family)
MRGTKKKGRAKPVLLVSRCLLSVPCRWDGDRIACRHVIKLKKQARIVSICPETEIGLGVPRPPIRIIFHGGKERLIQPETGRDLTGRMKRFAKKAAMKMAKIDGIILKSRSPSCGPGMVKLYCTKDAKEPIGRTAGVFALEMIKILPGLPVVDESGLDVPGIHRRFLKMVFLSANERRMPCHILKAKQR